MSMFLSALRTAAAKSVAGPLASEAEKSDAAAGDKTADGEVAAPDAKVAELTASVEKLTKQLQEKESKLKEVISAYQRSLADAENQRARTKREVDQAHQYGVQKFAKDLLSIADVLAIAVDSVKPEALANNKDLRDLHEGLTLTNNELHQTFHRHGIQRIDAVEGDKFDPAIHQAMYQAPVPGREPGTLLQVAKAGFKLHGRVLRPVQVGVVQDTSS
ncbi:GrpE-domain-containing protein [Catenaria anguillulae PL171]|uniref:GrpE protein homolog, mitochondrial n=1 Tax=Catenaria anguillulae PL171 TaxID=765915 RepID=A0A1Y2HEX5_9FUNG|nr:GrpE-domain-containing protein [Catenaria anguillulae PL171]